MPHAAIHLFCALTSMEEQLFSLLSFSLLELNCPYNPNTFFKKSCVFFKFSFREKGKEGEREGEKHQRVVASNVAPLVGIWPTTQACVLTGNRTIDHLGRSLCSIH